MFIVGVAETPKITRTIRIFFILLTVLKEISRETDWTIHYQTKLISIIKRELNYLNTFIEFRKKKPGFLKDYIFLLE